MSKKIPFPCICLSIFAFLATIIIFIGSCSKPAGNPPASPSPPPVVDTPPPVIKDTPSYVQRIEVDYIQSNPTVTYRNADYTFYYDTQKRVVKVGIKNYGGVLFDTATTQLLYSGNSSKPAVIIAPNSIPDLSYDTTYFTYDAFNRISKDSSMTKVYDPTTNAYVRRPIYRIYSYPSSTRSLTGWYGYKQASGALVLMREDTLDCTRDTQVVKLKSQWYYGTQIRQNYALVQDFTYTSLVNPLSKLNITGTVFSLFYTSVVNEVFGNRAHKAVNNSNILPYYLDFYSAKIPSRFYLGGFTSNDFLISAQYDAFTIEAVPWAQRTTYPSRITVSATTGLDSKFVYRYYY